MKVIVTKCQGLNSLGGCHRQERVSKNMTAKEAHKAGAVIENKKAVILPEADCDGWAGCKGGCNA